MRSPIEPSDNPQVDFLGDALSLVLAALFLAAVFFLTDIFGWWLLALLALVPVGFVARARRRRS